MSLKVLPPRVRAHLYLYWAGMILAGLGVVGFFLSFWQVGSPAQATIDVHRTVPVYAYAAIFAWVIGLALMWYGRRRVNAAVTAKLRENREAAYVDLGLEDPGADSVDPGAEVPAETTTDAPDGREA